MRFKPTGRWWTLLAATAAALLVVNLAMTLPPLGPRLRALTGGEPILDMRARGYGPAEVHALLTALGPAGRRLYATVSWTVDLLMPALMSAFLWTTVSLGSLRRWRWAALLGGAADLLENAAVTALVLAFPDEPATLVRMASAVTISKFALYLAGAILALAGAVRAGHAPSRSSPTA